MVVVSLDGGALQIFWRGHRDRVHRFANFGAYLAKFCGHGGNAVCLLHAPAGNTRNGHRTVGKKRKHGKGHGGIGNFYGVEFAETLQLALGSCAFHPVGAKLYLHAHPLQHMHKGKVSLDTFGTHAQDLDAASRDGGGGQRVTGRTGVAFDSVVPWALVNALGHVEIGKPFVLDLYPETFHHVQGQKHVGRRNQFSLYMNVQGFIAIGRTNQEGRQVLARNIPAHRNRTALKPVRLDADRRITFRLLVGDIRSKTLEGFHQIQDGAFPHAFFAPQDKFPVTKGQGRRQGPHGRARVSEEQFHGSTRLSRRCIHGASVSADYRLRKITRKLDLHAQLLQGLAHVAGIVAFQQVVQPGFSVCQGRNQKSAVRDTLGAR